jgi:amino acid transporter
MIKNLFRTKSVQALLQESESRSTEGSHGIRLNRTLTVRDLTALGVAAVIGAGIFSTIGAAAYDGGPGVIFLFIITAITCGFTALCYAEFASRVPVAGSAYTYSYVTFGEIIAWIIGWALILEYAIGNIVVAISWSSYFNNLLEGLGLHLPVWLTIDYQTAHNLYREAVQNNLPIENLVWNLAPSVAGFKVIMNLPASVIVVLITILAYIGIKESKNSANLMVAIKLIVLFVVIAVGVFYINTDNWTPFMPNDFTGVLKGVSAVFFAYIGFDAISTTAEECADPKRDLPRGMIYSLIICTIVYVITTLVITGMVNYKEFQGISDPLAYVFEKIQMEKIGYIISFSAVVAATSVLLVFQIGQPRIWMSMSRDGLLPKKFAEIHPRFHTPGFATIVTGIIVAIPALFIEGGIVTDLTSIGTLFAFVLVCGGVLLLPPKETKDENKFHLPYINGKFIVPLLMFVFCYFFSERIGSALAHIDNEAHQEILFLIFVMIAAVVSILSFIKNYSLIPILGMMCCLYLMIEIPIKSWFVFFIWMSAGLLLYFMYGYKNSRLADKK